MTEYKITNTIPAPATTSRRKNENKYPLKQLKPVKIVKGEMFGDSFLIPGKQMSQVSADLYKHAKRHGVSIALRTFPDGVRVYRLPDEPAKK